MNRTAIEYYQSIYPQIKNFCVPLKTYFNISLFGYVKIYKNGSYLLITNDSNLTEDFITRVTHTNIFFRDYLGNKGAYDCILWPSKPQNNCIQTYFNHGYWHGLIFVIDKSNQYIEAMYFL